MGNHPKSLKRCKTEMKIIHFEGNELKKLMDNLEKSNCGLVKLRTHVKRLPLIQNIMSDIVLLDRCINDITKYELTIDSFQTRVINAGIKSEGTIQDAHDGKSLQSSVNAHNEKIYVAREKLSTQYEGQLKIHADGEELRHLFKKN